MLGIGGHQVDQRDQRRPEPRRRVLADEERGEQRERERDDQRDERDLDGADEDRGDADHVLLGLPLRSR